MPGQWFAAETSARMDAETPQTVADPQLLALFEGMVERYSDKVFRLACSMLGNDVTAKDITQDVFLKVWKALPQYRGDASGSSWIYTIARNTCLTEIKRSRARLNSSLSDEAVLAEADQTVLLCAEESGAAGEMDVQALLKELPDHFRRVITLFYLEQKSYEEVATMMAIPMGTVKTYLHRARKLLSQRVALENERHEHST